MLDESYFVMIGFCSTFSINFLRKGKKYSETIYNHMKRNLKKGSSEMLNTVQDKCRYETNVQVLNCSQLSFSDLKVFALKSQFESQRNVP